MKNKKKTKILDPQLLAVGVFKKRTWPWLFVIAAVLTLAVFYSMVAIEFFNAPRCEEHTCETFYNYLFHYADAINIMLIVAGALVVVAILCAILFIRKRSLTITATNLVFKKGRKTVEIPLDSIQSIDTGRSSIIVTLPYVKFKFSQLKNKKKIYDVLLSQLTAPVTTVTTVAPVITSTPSLTTMAAPILANPTLHGKIAYFTKLRDTGLITPAQCDKYIAQSYRAESSN